MELTLKNYATALSKDLILQSKKNTVRECDETEKGHFVAYVDDGSESFDVSITVKTGNKVAGHTCDCNTNVSFCRHKAALLISLANGEKTKNTVKTKKKESKAEALLEDAAPAAIKEWVRGLIAKNKDIELSLIHHFSVKEQLTPAEVIKITTDAIKAVVGNKKAVDQTQLKKLVELWTEVHKPTTDQYHANIADEKSFLNFHTMLESCLAFQVKADTSSIRIPKFVDTVLQQSIQPVSNLYNEEAWDKAIGYFITHMHDGGNKVRQHYLLHLENIINISSQGRKIKIIHLLAGQFGKSKLDSLVNGTFYSKFIFKIINENGLFAKYYSLFKPIYYDNAYNLELIRLLIENNHLDIAKKYCNEQIKSNYREEYNIPYLERLREIAVIQNDGATKVANALFPYTFNFDDYLLILNTLPEDERKPWRTKILSKARNASRNRNADAAEFCFKLVGHEKSYKKMIEYIDSFTSYRLVLQYFEPMVLADKSKLLEAIIRKSDDYFFSSVISEANAAFFPELFALAEKHYTADFLRVVIKGAQRNKNYYVSDNAFIIYMKKRLDS